LSLTAVTKVLHPGDDLIHHMPFLLVVLWNQASIFNGYRDIQRWM